MLSEGSVFVFQGDSGQPGLPGDKGVKVSQNHTEWLLIWFQSVVPSRSSPGF